MHKRINSALISVYHKDGLDAIASALQSNQATIYSTGGTMSYINKLGITVEPVESLTGYPSILDGRVKTLHPKVFGGILARRQDDHQKQLAEYDIPEIDLVVVDLYPFEQTLADTDDENVLIEKIDIGGIALLRAAAKNYKDVLVVSSREQYAEVAQLLKNPNGIDDVTRKRFAGKAFQRSSAYDTAIGGWLSDHETSLRYGENPHQSATFSGDLSEIFDKIQGKELSYNNLVDVDSAINLMAEFKDDEPTFAVIKHTNACGLATRSTVLEAWHSALAGDPISAFGGILICNQTIDKATAEEINKLFFEVLIAPDFSVEALEIFASKKKRVIIQLNIYPNQKNAVKTCLNGTIKQDYDDPMYLADQLKTVSKKVITDREMDDLKFAYKSVKHLKSNGISIVKNKQLIGMGCGQTSRIDALKQAILKARQFGFDLSESVMASDAFFPFPDCVEIAHNVGISAVIQPGGSIKDQDSIDFCDSHNMAMMTTGMRHFKH